jgi:hypothetical protein
MKSIVLLLFFIGIVSIIVGYQKQKQICPKPIIEYRYIPRTFYDEQLSAGNVLKQFSSIFEEDNPWVKDRNLIDSEATKADMRNFYTQQKQ